MQIIIDTVLHCSAVTALLYSAFLSFATKNLRRLYTRAKLRRKTKIETFPNKTGYQSTVMELCLWIIISNLLSMKSALKFTPKAA